MKKWTPRYIKEGQGKSSCASCGKTLARGKQLCSKCKKKFRM